MFTSWIGFDCFNEKPSVIADRGRNLRGTTSGSSHPHGMRPYKVRQLAGRDLSGWSAYTSALSRAPPLQPTVYTRHGRCRGSRSGTVRYKALGMYSSCTRLLPRSIRQLSGNYPQEYLFPVIAFNGTIIHIGRSFCKKGLITASSVLLHYRESKFADNRKSSTPIYSIPCSSLHGIILSRITTIFLNESGILIKEAISCCRFFSSSILSAD